MEPMKHSVVTLDAIEDLSLDEIVSFLHDEYALYASDMSRALHRALRMGAALTIAKTHFNYGEWYPWIDETLPFQARQAQKYMRIYKQRERLNATYRSHLKTATIDQAVSLLADPRDQDEQSALSEPDDPSEDPDESIENSPVGEEIPDGAILDEDGNPLLNKDGTIYIQTDLERENPGYISPDRPVYYSRREFDQALAGRMHEEHEKLYKLLKAKEAKIGRASDRIAVLEKAGNPTDATKKELADLKKEEKALRVELSGVHVLKDFKEKVDRITVDLAPYASLEITPTLAKNYGKYARAIVDACDGMSAFLKEKFDV